MGVEFVPALKDLSLEARQIRSLRTSLWLLAFFLAMTLFMLILIATSLAAPPKTKEKPDTPAPAPAMIWLDLGISLGIILVTVAPACYLQWRGGRTARWRRAAVGLLATILAELVLTAVLLMTYGTSDLTKIPLEGRALQSASLMAGLLQYWWIAVLIAEFGAACRATPLLLQTERLGYAVLASLAGGAVFAAWTIPTPPDPEDPVSGLLAVALFLTQLVLTIWSFRLLMFSAMLTRFLLDRISAAEQQLADKDDAESKQ